MTSRDARERIEKLKSEINRDRYAYHVLGKSLIPDAALDSLKKELFDLEAQFPQFVTADSPTQRVEGKPLAQFKKVTHRDGAGQEARMNSLNDAFSEDDVRAWHERLENYLGGGVAASRDAVGAAKSGARATAHDAEFYCDLKMDGLAVELVYENGLFVQGSTRGDGLIGEDITQNLRTVEAIPLRLEGKPPARVVARGETFLTKKEFARLNREQEKQGLKIYANPRNVAAGSIRQLDPKITASRKLHFYAYALIDESAPTKAEEYKKLQSFGIPVNPDGRVVRGLKGIAEFHAYWGAPAHREKLDYEIDGVVITVNDSNVFRRAGAIGKAPRGAVAYKFSPREATTIVRNIDVQVGRTGALTPVAILDPVNVGGVTITHATLHNADEIERLGLKIGDTVVVSRAGDVIPQISQVLPKLRTGKEKAFHMPTRCPVDSSPVVRDGVAYRCSNPNCGARHLEALKHFVSRGGFDIRGMGEKIIVRFLDEGLISDAVDIFALRAGDIAALPRFGEKSAEKLVAEIEARKKISLPRFLYSLGILHVGEETAIVLAQAAAAKKSLHTPEEVYAAMHAFSEEDLQEIQDIGPAVAKSIHSWFKDAANGTFMKKMTKNGVTILPFSARAASASGLLAGKSFVITGSLENFSRDEAKDRVRAKGGTVSESVSKKTDYVVVGAEPGSKYDKAKKLGVKILEEAEFRKLVA